MQFSSGCRSVPTSTLVLHGNNMSIRFTINKDHFEFIKVVLTRLKTLGITAMRYEFSGGGDEGNVEAAAIEWIDNQDKTKTLSAEDREWLSNLEIDENNVIESIINTTGIDWWNNDGGCGSLLIDVQKRQVVLNIGVYEQKLIEDETRIAKF
jgi:hypothetical protein